MPPKVGKGYLVPGSIGVSLKNLKKQEESAMPELIKVSGPPPHIKPGTKPVKRKRKDLQVTAPVNSASEMSLDDNEPLSSVQTSRKVNGRPKSDETGTHTSSSVESREHIPASKSYKSSRGIPDRTTHVEKQPSIEDAVYIYRALMNNGTRPPIFLQRSLVYLPQFRRTPNNYNKSSHARHAGFEKLIEKLSSLAAVCSQVQLTLTNILNVRIGPVDKKEITIDLFLLKNCYKRRKTDVTSKEKFIKSINLSTPFNMDALSSNIITLDSNEISSDIGSHHMSACYLKAKVTIATERKYKPNATTAKKQKKKYYAEVPEPKYQLKEFISTLLLYSGGKSYLPSGKQTLFLYEVEPGKGQTTPQYMDWNDLSSTPQLVLDSVQFNHRRSPRSSSPSKHTSSVLTNHKSGNEMDTPNPITDNLTSSAVQEATTNGEVILPSTQKATEKLYFVLQYKGAPQTTVQVGFTCPFCLKKTRPSNVVFLLKHLRLCHSRLLFLYKETDGEPAIIVTVNTYYDGSYTGNPLDIIPTLKHSQTPICESFKRAEPTRRTPYTELLNIRANKKQLSLEEFSRPEPLPLISNYSSLLGHNRLYYHSVNNQPILSNDFDVDSDGEDMEWMRIASSRLIDEFIDVNKGEKELMKLWNNFVSRNTQYICDLQMEEACLKFVREHSEIVSFKLRNNFLCHLGTLYDSGVLQTRHIKTIIDALPKKSGTKAKGLTNGYLGCNI